MTHARAELSYEWAAVLQDDDTPYRFPSPLNRSGRYATAAVYRWLPFRHIPGDIRRVYVGEAENLARRVYGYLKPGPLQATNIRMRELWA